MNFDDYKNTKPYKSRKADQAVWEAYNVEQARIECQFKPDLFADLGITDNPKREELFRLAWSYGHASGYEDVYNYALDLVDLIN